MLSDAGDTAFLSAAHLPVCVTCLKPVPPHPYATQWPNISLGEAGYFKLALISAWQLRLSPKGDPQLTLKRVL